MTTPTGRGVTSSPTRRCGTCHHHLFDLPRRPRFDRYWRQAWDGYRRYNQIGVRHRVRARGAGLRRPGAGLPLLASRADAGRGPARSAHRAFLPHSFRRPEHAARPPRGCRRRAPRRLAGFDACGFHAHRWEAAFRACYADPELAALDGRVTAPATFVSSLSSDHDGLLAEAASDDCARSVEALRAETGGRRIVLRVDRVEPSKNIVRGMLAFEELLIAYPEWIDKVVHVALVYPSRQGLADYLALGAEVDACGRADQSCLGDIHLDPHHPPRRRRPPPFTGCADDLRRVAGEPGSRRPQPRRQGRCVAQRQPTGSWSFPTKPARGRSCPKRPWASIPSTSPARPTPSTAHCRWTSESAVPGPPACGSWSLPAPPPTGSTSSWPPRGPSASV